MSGQRAAGRLRRAQSRRGQPNSRKRAARDAHALLPAARCLLPAHSPAFAWCNSPSLFVAGPMRLRQERTRVDDVIIVAVNAIGAGADQDEGIFLARVAADVWVSCAGIARIVRIL